MTTDPRQQAIIDEFGFFENWMDRYQYLIDLGKQLPALDESEKSEDNRLHGCQSQVWVITEGDADRLRFRANSDAAIVSGLIALLLRVFSDRSAAEITALDPYFVREIGLHQHLSPTRSNGLHAMLHHIKQQATEALVANGK